MKSEELRYRSLRRVLKFEKGEPLYTRGLKPSKYMCFVVQKNFVNVVINTPHLKTNKIGGI